MTDAAGRPAARPCFTLQGVTFRYPPRGRDRQPPPVLWDVNLRLPAGRTVVLLGVSGLGKTTLLNLLALIWERDPPAGEVTYHSARGGRDVPYRRMSGATRRWLRRQEFGLVPQVPHFLSGFTCRQNLHIGLAVEGEAARGQQRRIEEVLQAAHFPDLVRRLGAFPNDLSTGQRQRLSTLRAVLHDPAVLFADEPVSNLDEENKRLILRTLRRWRRGEAPFPRGRDGERTLILICHEIETAWQMVTDPDDVFLFLRKPAPDGPPGARVEAMTRREFLERHPLPQDAPPAVAGPNALREELGLVAEDLDP